MASSDKSAPRAEHTRAAAAAAERKAGGAGCQGGGPWLVSSPMHNGEALMTPTPRSWKIECSWEGEVVETHTRDAL